MSNSTSTNEISAGEENTAFSSVAPQPQREAWQSHRPSSAGKAEDDSSGSGDFSHFASGAFKASFQVNEGTKVSDPHRRASAWKCEDSDVCGETLFRDNTFRMYNGELRRFWPGVFVFEFLTQLFYPLSLPVVLATQGKTAAKNKHMLPKASVSGVKNFLMTLLLTFFLWFPAVYVYSVGVSSFMLMSLITSTSGLYHRFTIAGKYASFTKEYYLFLMTSEDADCGDSLLLAVWYRNINVQTQGALLTSAIRYSGVPIDDLPEIQTLSKPISVEDFLRHAVNQTFGHTVGPAGTFVCYLLSLGFVALPITLFMDFFNNSEFDIQENEVSRHAIITVVSASIQVMLFTPRVLMFNFAGALHYYRKFLLLTALHEAYLRPHSHQAPDNCMVRLKDGNNVDNWSAVRLVGRFFGRQYENRVAFNTICSAVMVGATFLYLIISQFVLSKTNERVNFGVFGIFIVMAVFSFVSLSFAVLCNSNERSNLQILTDEEEAVYAQYKKDDDLDGDGNRGHLRGTGKNKMDYVNQLRALRTAAEKRLEVEPIEFAYVAATPQLMSLFFALITTVLSLQAVVISRDRV